MAERRMFSKVVTGSGRFLMLSPSARLLYYDLGMEADDDGMVEAFRVLRATSASESDLRELEERGFISIKTEDLVTEIVDWNRNNLLRKDRYRPGAYTHLAAAGESRDDTAGDSEVKEGVETENQNEAGRLTTNLPAAEEGLATNALLDTCSPTTQERLGNDRTGKDRPGKEREEKGEGAADKPQRSARFTPPTVEEVRAYVHERGSGVDPQRFTDFYASKGWRVGSQPMKDWRAAVRTWERREEKDASPPPVPPDAAYREGW